jgi:hypothetical protein
MSVTKPPWLRGILEHWLLNWRKGELLTQDILIWRLRVPPWDILIGLKIEQAVDWVIDIINWIEEKIAGALDTAGKAWNWVIDQGGKVWNWFAGIDDWFIDKVWPWIQNVKDWVGDWFLGAYRWLIDAGGDFVNWFAGIDDWFASRWRDLWATISAPIKNVTDWFDLFGRGVTDFLNDPFSWLFTVLVEPLLEDLLNGFDRGLEGKEEEK